MVLLMWIGYFFLGLLILLFILLCIHIKVELKVEKGEQWAEVRYLFFKYRVNFHHVIDQMIRGKLEGKAEEKQVTQEDKVNPKPPTKEAINEPMPGDQESQGRFLSEGEHHSSSIKNVEEVKVQESNQKPLVALEALNVKKPIKSSKAKKRWKLKGPKAVKAFQSWRVTRLQKLINFSHLRLQYYRFKAVFKEAKVIVYRLLKRLRIHHLNGEVQISIDDPFYNAQLIALIWGGEAGLYRILRRYFRRVDEHHFNVTSSFSGNEFALEVSCLVSFRLVDLIIVIIFSIKELLAMKRLLGKEKAKDVKQARFKSATVSD